MKSVSAKKSRGDRTSKIVISRQSCSNGHLPYHCLFYYLARARSSMTWPEFAQKQLARTSLMRSNY